MPANRIGHALMTVAELQLLQEVISLTVLVPFAMVSLRERPTGDSLWAGLCLPGAVYFMFRSKLG